MGQFDANLISELLADRLTKASTTKEKIRASIKLEDFLINKGTIALAGRDREKYLKIASDMIGIKSKLYSSCVYVERHGNRYEKGVYTLENATGVCNKVRDRISAELRRDHPEMIRVCCRCGKPKHISEFYNNGVNERRNEKVSACKECEAEREVRRTLNKVASRETNDSDIDIIKYAASEITANLSKKGGEINNLFAKWSDALKTMEQKDKDAILTELWKLVVSIEKVRGEYFV